MKINIKPGTVFKEINDYYIQIFEALNLLPYGSYTPTITSANDGKHMDTSLHYKSRAVDIRVNDRPNSDWPGYRDLLARRLGPSFQVILEKDHLHIEYDPKAQKT